MDHKIQSVQTLYDDAVRLFKVGVMGSDDSSADSIINNLGQSINILKGCWEGKDAGVQINNIVTVFNGMVTVRNALAELAVDSSKIAANYRGIQNSNGAGLEALTPLVADEKTMLPAYSDTRDTISISQEANNGKARLDAATSAMPAFISSVNASYEKIMNNWTVGTGREKAKNAFDAFMVNSKQYSAILDEVSQSISNAVKNYSF